MMRLFLASISFIMFYFSLFSSTAYESDGKLRISRFILWMFGLICFFLSYSLKNDQESETKDQLRTIAGISFIFQLLLLPSIFTLIKDHAIFALFVYIGTFFLSILLFCIDFSFWRSLLTSPKYIYSIIATLIVASTLIIYLQYNTVYFLWDSHSMYEIISENTVYSLLDFSKLSLSNHVSYSYVAICTIFKLLVGNAMVGQALFGFTLYAIGVYGFYKCIVLFTYNTNTTKFMQLILTCLFASSPYMLGTITYSYPDYAMWCIMPILVYCLYTQKYLLVIYTGFFFIFCKETSLITYVFLILGFYIIKLNTQEEKNQIIEQQKLSERKNNLKKKRTARYHLVGEGYHVWLSPNSY